ncbi:MAG: PaaI family thioesterase [Paracoccaceae bacterium]
MLKMDKAALTAFLAQDFPEVDGQFVVDRADADGLVLRLVAQPQHLRPGGTVSGPTMFALADVAVYLAILSRIGPFALTVTTNASIDFMRKPQAGVDLLAEVRLLKLGRSLAVGDALIRPVTGGDPVARASLTYAIPPDAR